MGRQGATQCRRSRHCFELSLRASRNGGRRQTANESRIGMAVEQRIQTAATVRQPSSGRSCGLHCSPDLPTIHALVCRNVASQLHPSRAAAATFRGADRNHFGGMRQCVSTLMTA